MGVPPQLVDSNAQRSSCGADVYNIQNTSDIEVNIGSPENVLWWHHFYQV